MSLSDMFTIALTTGGLFFFIAGTAGLLRFPDTFCRLHALTKADNLGLGMIVLGLLPQLKSAFDAVQLIFTWLLVMFASAACCFLVANRAEQQPPNSFSEDVDFSTGPDHER